MYLLLERLQLYVVRTLLKRVARILGTTKLPLATLQAALAASTAGAPEEGDAGGSAGGAPAAAAPHPPAMMEMGEVECLVANLIAGRLVKGYLSLRPPFLVISARTAFPPLAEVAAGGGARGGGGA